MDTLTIIAYGTGIVLLLFYSLVGLLFVRYERTVRHKKMDRIIKGVDNRNDS